MRKWAVRGLILLLAVAGALFAWRSRTSDEVPPGFAAGNGRIEAVELHIAAKTPGRVKELLVDEGDFVRAGQPLARIDTATLEAQLREAEAQLQQAIIGVEVAESHVAQREAERGAAQALVAQREAERDNARRQLTRSEELARNAAIPQQRLDDDRAHYQGAEAALSAASAQVSAAEAAIGAARAEVVRARAAVEAWRATIQRIQAEIDDATLVSPRDGRVQYRIVQPGEVVAAGGKVLNVLDLGDVYMTFFLPAAEAGRVKIGAEARLVLDAAPEFVIPATVSYVADVAQFTPKTVETRQERVKLMFRVKARIAPDLLQRYVRDVKTGLPGMAYVRLDPGAEWPPALQVRLPR